MGAFGMILMIQLFISICIGKPSQLKFNSNGRFKIVQFTDLQYAMFFERKKNSLFLKLNVNEF